MKNLVVGQVMECKSLNVKLRVSDFISPIIRGKGQRVRGKHETNIHHIFSVFKL